MRKQTQFESLYRLNGICYKQGLPGVHLAYLKTGLSSGSNGFWAHAYIATAVNVNHLQLCLVKELGKE